ncbi:MAG: hypothetical protein JO047_14495 [Alphaproteobacteria bacterium]|nr:hypothetical protein [Alphaproteobacteria bacterium]
MDCSLNESANANYIPRAKTPAEHQQDMLAIAQQQFALACARSLCEPDNQKWSEVIVRLGNWLNRLEHDREAKLAA